jgi:hypothetical protein
MRIQLEQQYLSANLAQAKAFLAEAHLDDDPIGAHQFGQLVRDLTGKLSTIPLALAQAPASLALFFGGRPVLGSQGIHAEFSSRALDGFQKIVSQRFASVQRGPLASKGRLPLKDNTHLLITDVVRGSFGFVLQAAASDSDTPSPDTTLRSVVDKVSSTISRFGAHDDVLFDEAVSEIDERQKSTLSDFFKLLDTEGATLRIVEGERDFELDAAAVQRARLRLEHSRIVERTQEFSGQFVGWTDYSAKFELRRHDTLEVIYGTVAGDAIDRADFVGIEPYHQHVRATVKVREVTARNRTVKTVYTLLHFEGISTPENWAKTAIRAPLI